MLERVCSDTTVLLLKDYNYNSNVHPPSFTLVSEYAKTAAISNDCCFAAARKRACHDEAKNGDVDYHIPILGSYRHIMVESGGLEPSTFRV